MLTKVYRLAGSKQSRSAFIERVLRGYLKGHAKAALRARDLEILNKTADRLNVEAAEVLEYQLPGE